MHYAIRFGDEFAHEDHPASLWTDLAITDKAYLVIEADNEADAQDKLMGTPIRNHYAFIYPYNAEFREMIEEEELFEIVLDEEVTVKAGGGF